MALAGQISAFCFRSVMTTSSTAQVSRDTRICAIESRKSNATWPSTCSVVITTARCSRGSLSFGSTTGYRVPRNETDRPLSAGAAWAFMTPMLVLTRVRYECWRMSGMRLERASAIVAFVLAEASGPVSVFVADDHGELVDAATMDGAAPDTRLNAQRKAYTAARSDARSTRELADEHGRTPPSGRASTRSSRFFLGGVAVFEDGVRVGARRRQRPPGEVDEQLVLRAIDDDRMRVAKSQCRHGHASEQVMTAPDCLKGAITCCLQSATG